MVCSALNLCWWWIMGDKLFLISYMFLIYIGFPVWCTRYPPQNHLASHWVQTVFTMLWGWVDRSLFHPVALRSLRSTFWERQRGSVLSWRGCRLRWREQRTRAPLWSLKVRSMNWGNNSSRRTMNWKLLRTERTRHGTNWNGELCVYYKYSICTLLLQSLMPYVQCLVRYWT